MAQDQLDSALSAQIEVPSASRLSGRQEVGGLGGALILFGAAAFLGQRLRRRRNAPLRASRSSVDGPSDVVGSHNRPSAEDAAPTTTGIPLPPHVVATLERLARERQARAESGERIGADQTGQGGFEAWVGR